MLDDLLKKSINADNYELSKGLVDQGANPFAQSKYVDASGVEHEHYCALSWAISVAKFQAVRGMLDSSQFKFTRNYPAVLGHVLAQCLFTGRVISPQANELIPLILSKPREEGVNVNGWKSPPTKSEGECLLHVCIRIGIRLNYFSLLLDAGADPHQENEVKKTALSYAISMSHTVSKQNNEYAKCIVQHKSFLYRIPEDDASLELAVETNNTEMSNLLLAARAKTLARQKPVTFDRFVALYRAENHAEIPELLSRRKPLEWILEAINNNLPTETEYLLSYYRETSINYDELLLNNKRALYLAVEKGYEKVVEILLQRKANPNRVHDISKNVVPLWAAVHQDNLRIIDLLMNAGANANYSHIAPDKNSLSIFANGVSEGRIKAVTQVLSSPSYKYELSMCTGMLYSIVHQHTALFELFLAKYEGTAEELDFFHEVSSKKTALTLAVTKHNATAVKALVMRGSKPTKSRFGVEYTALFCAIDSPDMFELLIALGQFEFTADCVAVIHECIAKDKPELAIALMDVHEKGSTVDLNSPLRNGHTILQAAMAKSQWDLVEVLRRHGMKFKVEIGQECPVKLSDSEALKKVVNKPENKSNYERYLKSTQKMAITSKIYRLNDDPAENVVWDDRLLQKGCRFEL